MNALILAAHGSRRAQSNDEVLVLAERLKPLTQANYHIVEGAFLELAKPSIEETIKNCIQQGATSVVVLPYFLNSGRHAVEDIPNIVEQAKQDFPEINFAVTKHLGASDKMLGLLTASANDVLMPSKV